MNNQEYEQKKRECWEQFCRHIVDEEEEFYNMFDRAYSLGKQEKDAEETVISGWVARDKDNGLYLYGKKPVRDHNEWFEETIIILDDDYSPTSHGIQNRRSVKLSKERRNE